MTLTIGRRPGRLAMIGLALAAVTAWAAPASAHDGRVSRITSPPPSVFPPPRDPWRSWGLRSEVPRRVGPPRAHHNEDFGTSHSGRNVWVPGHWAWDGHAWVWWPGRWGIR
ncbi:MAG: hypothetical protein FJZ38_01635 [Candidatus Rokubacteria bacterium]|nr:hypothetical protein [Candidatus Rokubacteria bacterium]